MATENLEIIIGANTQDLQTGLNQASQSVTNFGNAVRANTRPTADATNALSNLSRVAQDAPYGFIGIANNLNPMLESFQRLQKEAGSFGGAISSLLAGLTGPAGLGLALGAVSSLFVVFSSNMRGHTSAAEEAKKAQDDFTKSLDEASKKAAEQTSNLNTLIAIAQNANATDQQRVNALNAVKEAIGKVNKDYAAHITNVDDAKKAVTEYTKALIQQAIVQRYQNELADKAVDLGKTQLKIEEAQANVTKVKKELPTTSGIGASMELQAISNEDKLGYAYKEVNTAVAKRNVLLKEQADLQKGLDKAIEAGTKMPLFTDLVTGQPKNKQSVSKNTESAISTIKETIDTSDLETLKLKQRLYQDDVYIYKGYADKIVNEELRIALEKAKINKASASEIEAIKEQSKLKLEINQVQFGKTLDKLFDAADKEWIKGQKETNKKIEEEEKRSAKELEKIEKEKASQLKELQKQHEQFAEVISQNVTNALFTMYDAIQAGEPPLKALGDFLANLAKQFAAAIIQATIFKGIMSLLNVATSGGSGFFGSILGGVSKLLGFAEGGIVSQPTIAMVGEGGQSEAIMPLNKLGNMMNSTFNAGAMSGGGAGNGQFVLKGNDLVLALQRSNYSLNLRRGA